MEDLVPDERRAPIVPRPSTIRHQEPPPPLPFPRGGRNRPPQEEQEEDSFHVQVAQIRFLLDYARGLLVETEDGKEESGAKERPLLPEVAAMRLAKQKRHEEQLRRAKAKQYDLSRRRRLIAQANPPNATDA